ncbi:hypothetical protein [Mesorhizobium sp.]|uniref:hypothetical protein n=1 Tax=Mesorhizobium sp. TaxID=1871066 RepID=UPI000FE85C53|nr:hypothetical protein [Mesorhizobium sp.]RWC56427.1 MAG: hypothetical protein EOS56_24270 [Mesorhizobium sp.]RWC58090.1 MAG: hypothetical protein EOS29_23815 [Mesorhizobium sp.]
MTKARRREPVEKHVYLRDRVNNWEVGLGLAFWFCAIGIALLVAAYSPDGFWQGLWEALKQLLNRV